MKIRDARSPQGRHEPDAQRTSWTDVFSHFTALELEDGWWGTAIQIGEQMPLPQRSASTRPCALCATPFQTRAPHQKYCSRRCAAAAHRRYQPFRAFKCAIDGVLFQSKDSRAKYCSEPCRLEGRRRGYALYERTKRVRRAA